MGEPSQAPVALGFFILKGEKMNDLKVGETFAPYNIFIGTFIPDGILNIKEIPITAKVVYGLLLRYSYKKNSCYPKQQTLADKIGITRNQINTHLNTLEKNKLILRVLPSGEEKLKHFNTRYYFLWHECFNDDVGCIAGNTPGGGVDITSKKESYNKEINSSLLKNNKEHFDSSPNQVSSKQKIVKRKTSLTSPPPLKPNHREDPPCPKKIKAFIDCWNSFPVRKHLKEGTITYSNAVDHIRMFIRGTFYNSLPVDKKFKGRKFSLEDFRLSISRFANRITNPSIYPKNKNALKSMSISDFLYNEKLHTNKSYFLLCLENENQKIVFDKNPELTSEITKVLQSTTGKRYNSSITESSKLELSSDRLHKYFIKNQSRLNGRFYSNKMKATVLVEAVLFDNHGGDITPGWLCSNETFNRRLPDYCEEHVWVRGRR